MGGYQESVNNNGRSRMLPLAAEVPTTYRRVAPPWGHLLKIRSPPLCLSPILHSILDLYPPAGVTNTTLHWEAQTMGQSLRTVHAELVSERRKRRLNGLIGGGRVLHVSMVLRGTRGQSRAMMKASPGETGRQTMTRNGKLMVPEAPGPGGGIIIRQNRDGSPVHGNFSQQNLVGSSC